MNIRKAKESDTPQLEELFLITRQETFHWESPEKFKLKDYTSATEGESVFVAVDEDDIIIGFISVWEYETPPFIHHLYVLPGFQREGVGELLLRSLLDWLPLPYRLKCLTKNRKALAFYQKNNWIDIDAGVSEEGEYLLLQLNQPPGE